MRRNAVIAGLIALTLAGTAACSSGDSGDSGKTITVAYQKFGTFKQLDDLMAKVKREYEQAHQGTTVKLIPIEAAENDYYTKLSLMNRSANTAPDVMYEDTFLVNTDIKAGYPGTPR